MLGGMELSIQDWGAVGEIISAIAVVISLLYLAVQIRNQNRESRLSTINNSLAEWNSLLSLVADNSELADIWNRGLKNEELTETEEVRFRGFVNSYFRVVEGLYLQHLEGRLDNRVWQGIGTGTMEMLASAGLHRFWSHRKQWYSREFQEYVEKTISAKEPIDESLYNYDA